ncbi:MAG: DUF1446 domain-containing protein [Gammaproteobacteria bacterium]|nr:DUF1446 domain-containing protein [Gammaproteobacteria bacterium]
MIRIAAGSGFWGDWPQAPALQVRSGPIDYLVLDYLAEVTTAILDKLHRRDSAAGYAHDFVRDLGELLPEIADRGIRVIASAGGVNPLGCAAALLRKARQVGVSGIGVGVVDGSDVLDQVREAALSGVGESGGIVPLDPDGPALADISPRLTSAHAYLGADPIVEALELGAQVVVTGRTTDASLALAPILHEFEVAPDDWDARALGTVVGHLLECGAQASGGNFLGDWRSVPDPARIGLPIAELSGPGRAVITKHESLGGLVNAATVKEQLVYEIADPRSYATADCITDFTTIRLTDEGPDRVGIQGLRGKPPPAGLKVTCVYAAGWKVTGELTYAWPEARAKARAAGRLVRDRTEARVGEAFDEWMVEHVGAGALFGALDGREAGDVATEPDEVVLRVAARSRDRAACEWLGRELVGLVLTGPPGATGYAAGRPRAREVSGIWSCLLPSALVRPRVAVLD